MRTRPLNDDTYFDVLCVGDVAADVFIRLTDPRVTLRSGPVGRVLELPFGDKVPFEHAETVPAGGNAANAAVALARLGLRAGLLSRVGSDATGGRVVESLRHEGVDTRFVQVEHGRPTNENFVLWCGDDRTILVHHHRYDYRWPTLRAEEVPRWLYLSSLVDERAGFHDELAAWLESVPATRLAFQPGTPQIALGTEALARLYRRADLLVCNRHEARQIAELSEPGSEEELDLLVERLHGLGPRSVVITDGMRGAYASAAGERLHVTSLPDSAPPVERTGAGDAFSATLVGALASGATLADALGLAPLNAASVVGRVGSQAGLLLGEELELTRQHVPEGFAVRPWASRARRAEVASSA